MGDDVACERKCRCDSLCVCVLVFLFSVRLSFDRVCSSFPLVRLVSQNCCTTKWRPP